MFKKKYLFLLTFLILLMFSSCKKENKQNSQNDESYVTLETTTIEQTQTETTTEDNRTLLEKLNVRYVGGLYARSEVNDMMLALFKSGNNDMDAVIITEGDKLYYGQFTTEEAKTKDGKDYMRITVENKTYGYHINEDKTGILVDQDGNVYDAKELDVSVATDMIARTVYGDDYINQEY